MGAKFIAKTNFHFLAPAKKDSEKMMLSFLQIKKPTDIVFKIIKFTDVCSSLGMCVAHFRDVCSSLSICAAHFRDVCSSF